jgi:hypothetical protein
LFSTYNYLQEKGENVKRTVVNKEQPPPPIIPRNINKKLKLLDIDPLEMARQLTIMEYRLFLKVRPMECILRARGKRAGKEDHIAPLIQSANLVSVVSIPLMKQMLRKWLRSQLGWRIVFFNTKIRDGDRQSSSTSSTSLTWVSPLSRTLSRVMILKYSDVSPFATSTP